MGSCFLGGFLWWYDGFIRIPNKGPILRDHRIYFDKDLLWIQVHLGELSL